MLYLEGGETRMTKKAIDNQGCAKDSGYRGTPDRNPGEGALERAKRLAEVGAGNGSDYAGPVKPRAGDGSDIAHK